MKKKILISGSYGTGNVGDEVILERLLEQFSQQDLTVLSQGTDYTRRYFPHVHVLEQTPSWRFSRILKDIIKCRISNMRARYSFLLAVWRCDIFIVGGGGLFAELVPQVLEFYLHQIKWAHFFKRKVLVVGVGVGPLRTQKGKENLGRTFNKCVNGTLVRDQQSLENLISVGVTENVKVCPDFAFLGNFQKSESIYNDVKKKKVILNIYSAFSDSSIWENADFRHQKFVSTMKETINYLLEINYEVELLPFGTSSDFTFCKSIAKDISGDISVFDGKDYVSIQERFRGAEFSITMRFHAGLLSFLHGVPTLCIDQQFKSERLLIDMNLQGLLLSLPDGFHKKGNKDLEFIQVKEAIDNLIKDQASVQEVVQEYFFNKKLLAKSLLGAFLQKHGVSQEQL